MWQHGHGVHSKPKCSGNWRESLQQYKSLLLRSDQANHHWTWQFIVWSGWMFPSRVQRRTETGSVLFQNIVKHRTDHWPGKAMVTPDTLSLCPAACRVTGSWGRCTPLCQHGDFLLASFRWEIETNQARNRRGCKLEDSAWLHSDGWLIYRKDRRSLRIVWYPEWAEYCWWTAAKGKQDCHFLCHEERNP